MSGRGYGWWEESVWEKYERGKNEEGEVGVGG